MKGKMKMTTYTIRSAYTYGKTKIFYEDDSFGDSEVTANLIGATVHMWLEKDYTELWKIEINFDNTDKAIDFLRDLHDAKPEDCIKWTRDYTN
jgi:hypothetical protein